MIDPSSEQIYPLREFARVLARERGIQRTYETIKSWVDNGASTFDDRKGEMPIIVYGTTC
jgi:hypothetical protein